MDVRVAGELLSVADGGLVDWTQQLVPSRKERLLISSVGVDRLALITPPQGSPTCGSQF
jgi:hypothetical protein